MLFIAPGKQPGKAMAENTADPVSGLMQLLHEQHQFFLSCAELDGFYEYRASIGTLTTKRWRPPRRGWTRADQNRFEFECKLDEHMEGLDGLALPPSVGPSPPGNIATRVQTGYRILSWRKSATDLFRMAIAFCDENIALSNSDAQIIRLAVESHLLWVDAYVAMSNEAPFDPDIEKQRASAIESLCKLSEITNLLTGIQSFESAKPLAAYPLPDQYERDKWIFENVPKMSFRNTVTSLERLAVKKAWYPISTRNGLKKCARRFAAFHGIEEEITFPQSL